MLQIKTTDQIGIIGLGYVGLPLAVEFGKSTSTIGFDIEATRMQNLKVDMTVHWKLIVTNFYLQII